MRSVALDATALLGRRTGVGVAVAGLLGALASGPHRVVGYGITGTGWRRLPALLPPGVAPAGALPLPARPLLALWSHLDLPTVESLVGRVDVVHGANSVVPPSRHAARLVTVHDLTPVRFPELVTRASRRYPTLIARAVGGGAHVHTPSAFVAGEVVECFGVDPDRVHVVAWGVTPPAPRPGAGGGPTGSPYVLATATAEPRKDLPRLVAAWDQVAGELPEMRLVLVGPPGWGEAELAAAIAAAAHRDRVERYGWVDDPAPLLAGAAVLAYPSRYEGFGFPPLEAMAAGVPVVASAAGAVPEVVGDAAALVPVGDTDALASGLLRVLSDPSEAARLVAAGRERAAGYSWAATGAAFAGLYDRLCDER